MKLSQVAKAAVERTKNQRALERREQNDAEFFRERRRQEEGNREKTARLKALRLAKEATDREAAAALESAEKVPSAKSRKTKTIPPQGDIPSE